MTEVSSCILSQYLWYNEGIHLYKASVPFLQFSKEKKINYFLQLFGDNCSIKKCNGRKRKYDLHENSYFQWLQLIVNSKNNNKKTLFQKDRNLLSQRTMKMPLILKGSRVITLYKLALTKIYSIVISKVQNKPSSSI